MKISTVSKTTLTVLVAMASLMATPAIADELAPVVTYTAQSTAAPLTVTLAPPVGPLEAVQLSATVTGTPGTTGQVMFEVIDNTGMLVNGAFTPFVIGADGSATVAETVSQDVPSPTFTFVAKITDAQGGVVSESKQLAQIVDSVIFGTSPAAALNPEHLASVTRLSGADRIQTAANISKSQFPQGAPGIILVNSEIFADATTAAALSAAMHMPVLLTRTNELAPDTANEVGRLLPHGGQVYILGGHKAVSAEIEHDLVTKYHADVTRLGGQTRIETANAVANQLALMGKANQLVVVDAQDWQSAVIAGPVAAKTNGVVLLSSEGHLTPATAAFIASLPTSPITSIGAADDVIGHGAVGRDVQTYTAGDITDRSLQVAQRYFPDSKYVGIASSESFPDGIVGAAAIAKKPGPIILLDPENPSTTTASYVASAQIYEEGFVFGGEKALPNHIIEAAF